VLTAVVVIIFVALVFDFINGFHDAANSIATVVSTRVLTPLQAVVWAAFFNFVAAFGFGVSVARTVGKGVVDTAVVDQWVIVAGLIGAIVWDLITWFWGLPTSSSHALIGGFAGAAVVKAGFGSLIGSGLVKIGVFMILAPLIGLIVGFFMMVLVLNVFKNQTPGRVDKVFRRGQLLSAAAYSLGHGTNDAQKTMGIIAVLGRPGGSRRARPGHDGGRLAHREDHGHADHQAAARRRLLRRDRGCPHLARHRDRGHPGEHHANDQRLDHGRGRDSAVLGGALGRGGQDPLGVDPDDSRLGDRGRRHLGPAASLHRLTAADQAARPDARDPATGRARP
jgi:Phosphate transporter family